MFLGAEMVKHLTVESTLDESLNQLPKQSVLTEQVIRMFIDFEQFVKQLRSIWHTRKSFLDRKQLISATYTNDCSPPNFSVSVLPASWILNAGLLPCFKSAK